MNNIIQLFIQYDTNLMYIFNIFVVIVQGSPNQLKKVIKNLIIDYKRMIRVYIVVKLLGRPPSSSCIWSMIRL